MKLPENMYPNGHPNNNTTESRREFEEWKHKQGGHYMSRNNTLGSDLSGYQDPFTEGQWKAWQAARERQWMPIESAPKDRTEILTLHPQFGLLITRWLGSREMWQGWAVIPTYWMPLPNPPTSEKTYSPFDEPMEYHQSISS